MIETKKCTKCLKYKPVEEFSFKNKSKGQRSLPCKDCKNNYLKEYYSSNDSRKNNIKYNVKNKETIARNIKLINEYLINNPCVDCGEDDLVVLEFDHVRGEKKFAISARKFSAYKWESLKEEIDKCEVRCANCHRRQTVKRRQILKECY